MQLCSGEHGASSPSALLARGPPKEKPLSGVALLADSSLDSVNAGDDCAGEHIRDGVSRFARRLGLHSDVTAAPAPDPRGRFVLPILPVSALPNPAHIDESLHKLVR